MATERQRLVETLFSEAATLDVSERRVFLISRCDGDVELQREVEELLGAHEGGSGVLDEPQPMTQGLMQQLSGLLRADDAALPANGKIGGYTVHRVLGSGGMGVVYLAEQERPKRTVALKVIRRGLATASLLRRFEHEAEILGRLHHPGIAQIYEAGVADDGYGPQPYIAMEYIDGRPLTEHAKVQRLGVREKLILMARVCEAVQHAHTRGVIHRDLKPGNILVQAEELMVKGGVGGVGTLEPGTGTGTGGTGGLSGLSGAGAVGQPKILDFGVARMAEGRGAGAGVTTMGTNVGQLIGTLAYMSPEQLGSDARELDTRSDVYTLGVVLFQLLAGKLPYDVSKRALPEAVRMIKDDPPTRLTSISKEYRGDLETIVAKAIEKEKGRRYQSAAELGSDLQRFLMGEPIAAKRDSALYVLRKQMLRYKGVVAAAAIGVMALVGFTVYAAISAERFKAAAANEKIATMTAQKETERADANAQRLQQELFVSNVERGRLEGVSGKVVVAEEFLWDEYFRDPQSPHARWALWELYEKYPCRWTVQVPERARCVAVSPNGKLLAVGGDSKTVVFLDPETGSEVRRIDKLPSGVMALTFDPAGERVLAGLISGAAFVAPADGSGPPRYLADPALAHRGQTRVVAWSPDGAWLATAGQDKRIRMWEADTLAPHAEWEAHSEMVNCMAFSADGLRLVSAGNESGEAARIRFWGVPDGRQVSEVPSGESAVSSVNFSPDGALMATGTYDRTVALYTLATGARAPLPTRFAWFVAVAAFSPDGRALLTAGGGDARVWHTDTRNEIMSLGQHRGNVTGGAWVGRSRAVTLSYDGALKCWEIKRAIPMMGSGTYGNWCFSTGYSRDGKLLGVGGGDGTIVILKAGTRERVHVIQTGVRSRSVTFMPGDAQLIAGSSDGMLRILNMSDGSEAARFGEAGKEIFAVSLHPEGRLVVSGHWDRTARVWDLQTHERVRELRNKRMVSRVEGVAFSPDGKLLATGGPERGILLWSTETWEPVAALEGNAQAWPVKFSPDGKLIAVGTWGNDVELWEVQTRLSVGTLTGHRGLISTIAFSADGTYLASGGDDAVVKLWHVKSRRCVLTLETYHGEATGLSFNPAGTLLSTSCQDHAAPTWDLTAMDPHIAGNAEYQRAQLKRDAEHMK